MVGKTLFSTSLKAVLMSILPQRSHTLLGHGARLMLELSPELVGEALPPHSPAVTGKDSNGVLKAEKQIGPDFTCKTAYP